MKMHQTKTAIGLTFAVFIFFFLQLNQSIAAGVQKGVYYPNTEKLAPDAMRVIALGTGLPTPLTKAQKSSNFMVELGNGDIFLFDVGTGSVENLFAIQPRFAKVDKVS